MYLEIIPLKPTDESSECAYKRWLLECYERAWVHALAGMQHGRLASRVQALVTAMKLLGAEGRFPLEPGLPPGQYYFPIGRLKSIFNVLLHSELNMTPLIARFREHASYLDVQQYGLKALAGLPHRRAPPPCFQHNYLELLDKLALTREPGKLPKGAERDEIEQELLCGPQDGTMFTYQRAQCRRRVNRCWLHATQWALTADARTHRRALLLLVERLLPQLTRPHLATDFLVDSLDAGGAISMLALQGVLDLVRKHNIDYPDIYSKLYSMFEPEIFATRYKARLLHLADIFLSSTHLPEQLVAGFAKRLARLALVAPTADVPPVLCLLASLLGRHPALKRMLCDDDSPTTMSSDPYVMDESVPGASGALGSRLWEVAALRRHAAPAAAAAAARLLTAGARSEPWPLTEAVRHAADDEMFNKELKKRFKSIEVNFIRPQSFALPSGERVLHYWQLTA